MMHPSEQLQIDEVSSPISAQILEFCNPDFFQETLQNYEVTSCPNYCYDENNSYATNLPVPPDIDNLNGCQDNNTNVTTSTTTTNSSNTTTSTATANTNTVNNANLSIIFDPQDELDNEISASIDFTPSSNFSVPQFMTSLQEQFDFSSVQPQLTLTDVVSTEGLNQYPAGSVPSLMGHPLPSVFEEDCLSSVPSYIQVNPALPPCSFLSSPMPTYMPPASMPSALSTDSKTMFPNNLLMGADLQGHELIEYQGDNGGIYCPGSMNHVFSPGDLQALSNDTQQVVGRAGSSTPIASDISSLEDSTFKVGKLSVEQRKEKIHRYMKKRNERNFSKKIKYACRKTLADSRPRVRGRFAKNDDFSETPRAGSSNHEDDDDDEVITKGEEEMADSAEIFAHISGVNSFHCNYPIQSWI